VPAERLPPGRGAPARGRFPGVPQTGRGGAIRPRGGAAWVGGEIALTRLARSG
jgi:hypothetical protein